MSFKYVIVCAGLVFGGHAPWSLAGDLVPFSGDVVQGMSVEQISKALASTALRRQPLRLVLSEKATSQAAEGKPASQILYHVIWVEPGSRRMRYDRVDYATSDKSPYVVSSFTDGVHSGRWESGVKEEDVPRLLSGDDSIARGGMCYLGPAVCYSPQIVLRVLGLTMLDKPMAEVVERWGNGATIIPDAAGDGLTLETQTKKLMFDGHGLLKQYLMFDAAREADAGGDPTIVESILVTATGQVGTFAVPTQICRRINIEGRTHESVFELRVKDCRLFNTQEMDQAVNPLLPQGTPLVGGKPGDRIETARRVFGEGANEVR
ncbi:hypothetical protein [Prosthecobacter sp.]|uniref:hypothetical protein n=1 Tax=Prosthecobacter sp. TaxID=1965333 RepID=UPI0037833633